MKIVKAVRRPAGMVALTLTVCLAALSSARAQEIPSASFTRKTVSAFPIVMYDPDLGFGYGGTAKTVNILRRNESLGLILFNSTKGERWYVFAFSIPDLEIRQGKRYGLSLDVRAEYDKYVKYFFYGTGPGSERLGDGLDSFATYRKEELAVALGHGFSSVLAVEAAYVLRQYKTYNVAPTGPFAAVLEAQGKRFAPFLSLAVRYDTSNSQIHPKTGFRMLLRGDLAGRALGAEKGKSFRWTLDARGYTRFLHPDFVFALRGLVQQVTGTDIALWDLSTLGGGDPMGALRGYALNRFMDKGKFLGCAEIRFPIWKRIGGTVFGEAGVVWPSWKAITFRKLPADAGFGLRYDLASFVVRADMGFSREGSGLYFNFGHMF